MLSWFNTNESLALTVDSEVSTERKTPEMQATILPSGKTLIGVNSQDREITPKLLHKLILDPETWATTKIKLSKNQLKPNKTIKVPK